MEGLMQPFADCQAKARIVAPPRRRLRRLRAGALLVACALAAGMIALPAKADDHGRGHWRHHHDRGWRGPGFFVAPGYPGYYAPPPVVYAPPPAYYAPPVYYAPAPSLNLVVPLHIR
jgi:hypothetical protein